MEPTRTTIAGIPALIYGAPSDKAFLYVHGRYSKKEEAESFARVVTPKGYRVVSFDLPEHGERAGEAYPCTVQNGVHDVSAVYDAMKDAHRNLSLYACSLGAYFSLVACGGVAFARCLFVSPILDMERLIRNMMRWSNVTEERLREEKRIETSFGETLSWEYYDFVRNHPITRWDSPTSILYGENDNLTERSVLDAFAREFHCRVTVMKDGEHYFHTPEQLRFLQDWIEGQEYE